ncbi:MAG: hypothetical protein DRH51_01545 [Candidatus Coatesbacteria bacterium]|nr:MAG: hypothetical protein DRH51_01545 [Candidatus Coatesbacteria bacterium]
MINAILMSITWYFSNNFITYMGGSIFWKTDPDVVLATVVSFVAGVGFALLYIVVQRSLPGVYPFRGALLGVISWVGLVFPFIMFSRTVIMVPGVFTFNLVVLSFLSLLLMGFFCEIVYHRILEVGE